jgi:hypothetical protein
VALPHLEETLQVLSAGWYQLAADAGPRGMAATQEVGAALANGAPVCRYTSRTLAVNGPAQPPSGDGGMRGCPCTSGMSMASSSE